MRVLISLTIVFAQASLLIAQAPVTLKGFKQNVDQLVFSKDGSRLATIGRDLPGETKLWDVATAKAILSVPPDLGPALSAFFFAEDKAFAVLSFDGRTKPWRYDVRLYDLNGKAPKPIRRIRIVGYGSDLTAALAADGSLTVADMASGKKTITLKGNHRDISRVSFAPNRESLATCYGDSVLKVWDLGAGKELGNLKGHQAKNQWMSFSEDSKKLATVDEDGVCLVWSIPECKELNKFVLDERKLQLQKIPGLKVTGGYEPGPATFLVKDSVLFLSGIDYSIDDRPGKPSAHKRWLAKTWDVTTGKQVFSRGSGWSASPLADGLLLMGDADAWKIWDVATGKEKVTLEGVRGKIVARAHHEKKLFLAGTEPMIRILDLDTGKEIGALKDVMAPVKSMVLNPQRKLLAAAPDDRTVKLWDITKFLGE